MTWFEDLTGFPERTPDEVRSNLQLEGTRVTSLANSRSFEAGKFSTPTLEQLRCDSTIPSDSSHELRISEIVEDVRELHLDHANRNAVFQVASQFNCLEMISPYVTPEEGVGIYEKDRTQGPVCSICAGAGTIFRNYLAIVNGRTGQSRDNQVDCLSEIGRHFENETRNLWKMQNGYCFPTDTGLAQIEELLANSDEATLDLIRAKLQVGIQSDTQVTISESNHLVTQVFCSGLPISYSDIPSSKWDYFPRLILDATYEATFHVALRNLATTGCNKLFLTLVGGGVFGNELEWILNSIARSLEMFASTELDVYVVSYRESKPEVKRLAANHGRKHI